MKPLYVATTCIAILLLGGCMQTTPTSEPRATQTCGNDERLTPYGCRSRS